MSASLRERAFARVENCASEKELETMIRNFIAQGDGELAQAARLRLYSIKPSRQPGTLEHDVWRSIFALEDTLSQERGKTIRLARTRQKIARDGELKTVTDLIMGKPSDGFRMLIERNMQDLTFEAVALRHQDNFNEQTIETAKYRIELTRN